MRKNVFLCFLRNLFALWRCDIYKDIAELKFQINLNAEKLSHVDDRELHFEILMYHEVHADEANMVQEELKFLKQYGLSIFPYLAKKQNPIPEVIYDKDNGMYYVTHNGKRLYFPTYYDSNRVKMVCSRLIDKESITGDGILEKCPHQYQSETFKIEEGDVLVDVGCAEALLSLDVIDKVGKVYLIESDLRWMPALIETFAPYKDKVVFVNKLVTNADSDTTITLATLLKNEQNSSLFIKMDIEGYETQVIESSKNFIMKHPKTKFACCTYHKANDAKILEKMFQEYGYETEFSDGFMLFRLDNLTPPYFRKGVIRAYKK